MKTHFLNPIYQLEALMAANLFSRLTMKQPKLTTIDIANTLESPIGASQVGAEQQSFFNKMKDTITSKCAKTLGVLTLSAMTLTGCDPEKGMPEPEPDTTNPSATITNVVVKDVDNDGQVDDVEISASGSDNVAVDQINVSVGGMPASKVGNVYVVTDLSAGQHTAKVEVTDTSGNTANATRAFSIAMANVAPTATIIFNDFGEHTPVGTIVGTVDAADTNGDTITTTLEEGGSDFELVLQAGQTNKYDIKTKVAFDYETAADNTHEIKVKVADATLSNEVTASANETDEDDNQGKKNLCGGHGIEIAEVIDVADNDPNTENLVSYVLDKDGNQIGTMEATRTDMLDTPWNQGGANFAAIKDAMATDILLKDVNGNFLLQNIVAAGSAGGIKRLSDNDLLQTDTIAASLMYMQEKLETAGYTYVNSSSWHGSNFASNPDDAIFKLARTYYTENIIKETDEQSLNEANEEMVLDALNKVIGLTATEADAILSTYLASATNQTGGQSCN